MIRKGIRTVWIRTACSSLISKPIPVSSIPQPKNSSEKMVKKWLTSTGDLDLFERQKLVPSCSSKGSLLTKLSS